MLHGDSGYLSAHFNTTGTTTVRGGPGIFHALVLNDLGESDKNRVIVRDDVNVIAEVETGDKDRVNVGEILYDAYFFVNLTVQRVGEAGKKASDITILFK